MREMSFDYYYDEQSESFRFLRVPRLLFSKRKISQEKGRR